MHATALAFPLAAIGVEAGLRRFQQPAIRGLLVWSACIALLSAFAVKSGIYAYVVVPAWIALAALGAQAVARGFRPSPLTMVLGAIASAPWLIPAAAGQRLDASIWGATWVVSLAAVYGGWRWPGARAAAIGLVALAVTGGLVRESQRLPVRYNQTGLRVLSTLVAPLVADAPPGEASFVSPEAPALSFYLFRSGTYWWTPPMPWSATRAKSIVEDPAFRFFVVDTTDRLYGGSPDSTTMHWLESSTHEITERFRQNLGRPTTLRVFVRGGVVPR